MRTIRKGRAPKLLTEYRAGLKAGEPWATYASFSGKSELRQHLLAEQKSLCCYCMGRIPVKDRVKIEHWHSQERYPRECLDYRNLLAACPGNENVPRSQQFCDTRKRNQDLSRNPANPAHRVEEIIWYSSSGEIRSSDKQFDSELCEVLNLNHPNLVKNRRDAVRGFTDGLPRGSLTPVMCQRLIERWSGAAGNHELPPFAGAVVYWLRKRCTMQKVGA